MNIHIEFLAQLGQLAGGKHRTVGFDGTGSAQDVVRRVIAADAEEFRAAVLDQNGDLRPTVLMFVRDEQVDWCVPVELRAGDTIVLASPIAGG